MYTNDYMYAVERDANYLAHYGILGMKWGVRRAIAGGNTAKLGRQYAKAQKKLAKLQNRANKTNKYAKRAALMGAGAAAIGGASLGLNLPTARTGAIKANRFLNAKGLRTGVKTKDIVDASFRAKQFGAQTHNLGNQAIKANRALNANGINTGLRTKDIVDKTKSLGNKGIVSNSQLIRAGGLAVGGALAVGAARNAYKAATAKRKVEKFRKAMNESFKGTKYATGSSVSTPRQGGKKRRRR